MNMKMLSLSSLLIIANFINGIIAVPLSTKEKIFYKKELKRAKFAYNNASLTKARICKKLNGTKEGKEWFEKHIEHTNGKATLDDYKKAEKIYKETTGYKNEFVPALEEEVYHWFKIVNLEAILAKKDSLSIYSLSIEDVINRLEKTVTEQEKEGIDLNDSTDFAKINRRTAEYFRSLAEQLKTHIN